MSNPALTDEAFVQARTDEFQAGWAAAPGQAPQQPLTGNAFGAPPQPPVERETVSPWPAPSGYRAMRVSGVATATGVLLLIMAIAGWFGWQAVEVVTAVDAAGETVVVSTRMPPWLLLSWIVGFGLAMFTIFKPKTARITAPLYAVAEGLLVGAISKLFEVQFQGIVLQAVGLTIGVFIMMLGMFALRIIRVTEKVRMAVIASTGAVFLVYLLSMILQLFGSGVPFIHDAGPIGIGFSLLVVVIASFNLLLDFDLVERGVAAQAPRYMEWYAGFGLLVTLVWLYLEILRLLAKLRQR